MKNGLLNARTREEAIQYAKEYGIKNYKVVTEDRNGFGPFWIKKSTGEYVTLDNK